MNVQKYFFVILKIIITKQIENEINLSNNKQAQLRQKSIETKIIANDLKDVISNKTVMKKEKEVNIFIIYNY